MELKRSELIKITEAAATMEIHHTETDAHADARNKGPMVVSRLVSPRRTRTSQTMAVNYHHVQNVHARDLRKFDATFASTNDPFVSVRKQAILIGAGIFDTRFMG